MRRLKDVSVFFLTLILGLCVISAPALAEWPWATTPPQLGQGNNDPPNPKGGPAIELVPDKTISVASYYSLITEISYYLTGFCVDNTKTTWSEQDTLKEVKNTSIKVD